MQRLIYWLLIVAFILIFGLIAGARAANAEGDMREHICGLLYETARLAYVRDAAGMRAPDAIQEARTIWQPLLDSMGRDMAVIDPYLIDVVLRAYQSPKLSLGIAREWDVQIEQDATRFAVDIEAQCLLG